MRKLFRLAILYRDRDFFFRVFEKKLVIGKSVYLKKKKMTLSKIELLQRGFHNIKNLLHQHSLSCFFFNNSLQLYSTCSKDSFPFATFHTHFDMSHNDLYHEIDNVKCRNITDFSMISWGIKTFASDSMETIKIIISDGFHTEYSKPIDDVKQFLFKKFDYAIGLGNHESDFDKIFLESIGKQFYFHCVTEPFDFGFLRNSLPEYIELPPSSKVLTCTDLCTQKNDNPGLLSKPFIVEHKGIYHEKRRYVVEESKVEHTKHYIFFIDISGSMDNRILQSSIVTNYYKNCNYRIETTRDEWTKIPIYNTQELIIVTSNHVSLDKKDNEDQSDVMIRIVTKLDELKEEKTRKKIDYIMKYEAEVDTLGHVNFKKYFHKQYYSILSNAERTYLKLSNSFPVVSTKVCEPIENMESFSPQCVICYENEKTELFNCLHFVSCYRCCLKLIGNKLTVECPICREEVSWIGTSKKRTDTCEECQKIRPSVFSYPSGEIILCQNCLTYSEDTIQIPFFFT